MTVAANDRLSGPHNGNGVTTAFGYDWYIGANTELRVILRDEDGEDTTQTLTTHYTVSGVGSDSGGNVMFVTAPPTGSKVIIEGVTPKTQTVEYENNDRFPYASHQAGIDKIERQIQELQRDSDRAVKYPHGETVSRLPIKPATTKILAQNSSGEIIHADAVDYGAVDPINEDWADLLGLEVGDGWREALPLSVFGPVDPRRYDASSGASAADNQTAFASIPRGSQVDLQGQTYTVTDAAAIIFDLHLYNGALKVGSARYPMPRNPMAHPLASSEPKIIEDGTQVHYWPGPVANFSGTLVGCWADSQRHETTPGAPLLFERSKDGVNWEDAIVIYSNNSYDPRPLVGAKVSTSRFGVLFCEVDGSGNINATKFAYTDNPTAQKPTFTTVDVGTVVAYWHPEPLIEGNTVHFFGYGGSPDIDLYRLTSTNLGAAGTWSVTKIVEGSTSATTKPVEPAVVKIDTNKYLLIARDDNGGNAYASTSTDLTTWTALVDTGINLGLNPPAAIVTWGKLWFYAAARSDDVDSLSEALIVYEADADTVYAAGGVFTPVPPPRVVMRGKPSMTGYLTTSQIDPSVWIGFMIDGEEELGSSVPTTARLLRLGGYEVPSQVALIHRRRPPITQHNTPIWWPYGDVSGITARTKALPQLFLSSSSQSISATKTQLSDTIRDAIPWSPPYAARLQSASGGSGRQLMKRIYGRESIAPLLGQVITGNLAGYGQLPGYYQLIVSLNFGTGGSPTATRTITSEQAAISSFASGDGLKVVSLVTCTPRVTAADTWGSNDDAYMDIYWLSNDAGAVDFYLTGFWADLGNEYIPLDPEDIQEVQNSLRHQTELLTFGPTTIISNENFGSTSSGVAVLRFAEKRKTPSVSLATGVAASDFVQNGSVACTGVTFDLIGRQTARMLYASSAAFTTGLQEMRATSNGVEILVEAIT